MRKPVKKGTGYFWKKRSLFELIRRGKRVKIFLMGLIVALLVMVVWHTEALADPPQFIRYQARLTDAAGVPLAGIHNLTFAIFDQATAGTSLWSEGPVAVNLAGAGVDRLLGQVTPLTSAVLTAPARWLEVTVDGTVLSPRQRLASVPFAMVADRLGTMTLAQVQADVDARIGTHAANPAAHHIKTTDATELISGTLAAARLADASVPAAKLIDGPGSGLDADTLDGVEGSTFCIGAACSRTPQQIAMLRWYEANETGISFPVGSGPVSLAFDGSNIWVLNIFAGNVMKLRASDGTVLGTFAAGGTSSQAIVFDGSSIWVANQGTNNVTKLRASDGTLLGTFSVGTGPVDLAFDGANIWVANQMSNNVTKLRASDGALLGTFPVSIPAGLAFDGSNIWVARFTSNSVMKLRASDGFSLGTFGVGSGPVKLAFDGSSIWVVNAGSNTVTKLRASDGAPLGTFTVGTNPRGLVFDGASIWLTNFDSNTVTKLRATDGTALGTFSVGTRPQSMVFDGASVWVANSGSSNVTKL